MTDKHFNKSWSRWRNFPDPKSGDYLSAPFGRGVYELRNKITKKLVLFGMSKNVAHRMSSLLPAPVGTGTRKNMRKREYVKNYLNDIDYRTKACLNVEEAKGEEQLLRQNKKAYEFST